MEQIKIVNPLRPYNLTDKEIELVELCRSLKFGKLLLYIEYAQPERVENMLESIKFGLKNK